VFGTVYIVDHIVPSTRPSFAMILSDKQKYGYSSKNTLSLDMVLWRGNKFYFTLKLHVWKVVRCLNPTYSLVVAANYYTSFIIIK